MATSVAFVAGGAAPSAAERRLGGRSTKRLPAVVRRPHEQKLRTRSYGAQCRAAGTRKPIDQVLPFTELPANEMIDERQRRSKVVCTIGPSTSSYENLLRLAAGGMNMVRLNMSHGDYDFHRSVVAAVRRINDETPMVVGVIVDVGSLDMVRLGEFSFMPQLDRGDRFTLTIRHQAEYEAYTSEVSFDGFIDVADVGDLVQVEDSAELRVVSKTDVDVVCEVVRGGAIKSRSQLTIRGKSYGGTSNEVPDADIDFVVSEQVDYVSLAFVEDSPPVENLRKRLRSRGSDAGVIAKIESPGALANAERIVRSSDAVMIARGDLGASIAYEKVPLWQESLATMCRANGKPSLVSTHFLDSMVVYPTPTRAEVTDIFEAVRQKADALVLTSETASGKYPFKALAVMHAAALRMESRQREVAELDALPPLVSAPQSSFRSVAVVAENIAASSAILANQRGAQAILVFTQKGLMASLVARNRPNAPIYAFTPSEFVQNKLTIQRGVRPFVLELDEDPEKTIADALQLVKQRGWLGTGELVVVVADVLGGSVDASPTQKHAAFQEFKSSETGLLPATRVRPALRRLALKASDALELRLARSQGDEIDFDRFNIISSEAKQIVHTVQLRHVP